MLTVSDPAELQVKTPRKVIGDAIGRQYADIVIEALEAAGFTIVPKVK